MAEKPDPAGARKFRAAARRAAGHLPAHLPPVLVLSDPERSGDLAALASRLPYGWGLVYRHFGAPDRGEIAHKLTRITRHRGLRLLIGADPELAFKVGAEGVHWPERLLARARRHFSHFSLNTASAHEAMAVAGPQPLGLDARVLSTVFPSSSPSAAPPMSALRFRLAVREAPLPVYGLGGVTAHNAGRIAGLAGLAGVSGFA